MSDQKSGDILHVMQVIDTLDIGGAERVAVQLANLLPRDRVKAFLCTTRRDGPLEKEVAPHVSRIRLNRKRRLDVMAVLRLARALKENHIDVAHAHGSSIFITRAAATLAGTPAIVWHDHYGRCELGDRSAWLYRKAVAGTGVIAVNQPLAEWARKSLHVPAGRVWFVPNWVPAGSDRSSVADLPGVKGSRIVCVANFRAQKDHINLLRAMSIVKPACGSAHLLLVGSPVEQHYADYVRSQVQAMGVSDCVSLLGSRHDVAAILRSCDIGVLSSVSEGLPLALLEYGNEGLAIVATDVGQCREVLGGGLAGRLVPPSNPEALAAALIELLGSAALRQDLGETMRRRIASEYDSTKSLRQICGIYDELLGRKRAHAAA